MQNFIYAVPGVRWLGDNSYFYSQLFNTAWIFAKLQMDRLTAKQASAGGRAEPTEIGGFEYTIPTRVTHFQTDLAIALIERMQRFCEQNAIRLIVVDVPAFPEPYRFTSSVPAAMVERLAAARVELITSQSLLGRYDGAAEMHVLHGYHHISEFTHALIGDNVIFHPGCRIGQDGFRYQPGPKGHTKVPQIGRVIIQDNVEIGAGTAIDRGGIGDTVIGEGTKIDNMVHIGHNAIVGRHCVIAGQCGISGSTVLGDFVVLAGQVGLVDHITIGDGAMIGAQSGVFESVPAGAKWFGYPAAPSRDFMRSVFTLRKLSAGTKKVEK